MKGQTVLVTGGTSGIGFFTAQALAARGARVAVTGRDARHGLAALDRLRRAVPGADVEFLDADHETVRGNQRLARRVRARFHRLDVLVNNVGGLAGPRVTDDGYDATLALNAVGPFALTESLLPLLHAAGRSRVVHVACGALAHFRGDAFAGLDLRPPRVPPDDLGRAKLLGLLWTLALARRPEGREVAVNAADPGLAWTLGARAGGARSTSGPLPWPVARLIQRFSSPASAAFSSIVLAQSPEAAGRNGELVGSAGRPLELPPLASDRESQDRAWSALSDLVKRAPTALSPSLLATDPQPTPPAYGRPEGIHA
jgi:NAD(P)-dependent dehydrogenase (short-subunit alcohol dehydrogenase family)